jgi:copper chaperone CopZ
MMVLIRFHHNPFIDKSLVYFDDTLYEASSISKYLNRPFCEWVDKIIELFSFEANDDYSLKYIGFECYGRILKYYADKDSNCKIFQIETPLISDGVIPRLNKLSLLCQNGLEISRISEQVVIFTDGDLDTVEKALPKTLRLSFYKMNLIVRQLRDITEHDISKPCFVVSANDPNYRQYSSLTYYFQLGDGIVGFEGMKNNVYLERCSLTALSKIINTYLEMSIYSAVIKQVCKTVVIETNNPTFRSFIILNRTEPYYLINIPASLELGERTRINCEIIPEWCKSVSIDYRSFDSRVVEVRGSCLEAMGTGETTINITSEGKSLGNYPVRVYRRIRATDICFSQPIAKMAVGEKLRLEIEYEPHNADNIPLIDFNVFGNNVMLERELENVICVTAESCGASKIIAQLENLDTVISIHVFPKLEHIDVQLDKTAFKIGDIAKAKLSATPIDALVGDFNYTVTPSSVARFDRGVGALVGTNRGKGLLTVTEKRTNTTATVSFIVN